MKNEAIQIWVKIYQFRRTNPLGVEPTYQIITIKHKFVTQEIHYEISSVCFYLKT